MRTTITVNTTFVFVCCASVVEMFQAEWLLKLRCPHLLLLHETMQAAHTVKYTGFKASLHRILFVKGMELVKACSNLWGANSCITNDGKAWLVGEWCCAMSHDFMIPVRNVDCSVIKRGKPQAGKQSTHRKMEKTMETMPRMP